MGKLKNSKILVACGNTKMYQKDCIHKIYQKDLPLVIHKSGIYELAQDLHFSNSSIPAITIDTNSVTLNLKDHTIDLLNTGIQAISVGAYSEIKIINGNIKNGSFTPLQPFIIPPFTPITNIPNIICAGIRLNGSSNVVISEINIDTVEYGIVGTNMIGEIVITNSQIYNFGVNSQVNGIIQPIGSGIVLTGSSTTALMTDVNIQDSEICSQSGYNSILLNFANGALIQNVQATAGRVSVVGATLGCFTATDSQAITIKNCVGRYNTQPFFFLRSNGVNVIDCQSLESNHNGTEFVFCNDCTLQNFITHALLDSSSFPGSGIKVTASNNFTVENCIASGFTNGIPSNGSGITVGGSNGCIIKSNKVQNNNSGIIEVLTITLGPNTYVGTPSLYTKNIAFNNGTNYVGIPNTSNVLTAGPWDNVYL